MSQEHQSYQSLIDAAVYGFILKIFDQFESESATVKFKQQFLGGIDETLYPDGHIGLEIEGLPDFPFILKIQIKTGYLQLKIYFADKSSDYSEVELRYYRSTRQDFEANSFYVICSQEDFNLNASEGLELFIQKFDQYFKAHHDVYSITFREY